MSNSALTQVEDGFKELSTSEQLLLIERLVHHVRETTLKQRTNVDAELAIMANDPQIQNELRITAKLDRFRELLSKVPDAQPEDFDRL
jgi:hypothetical protein